jgi:hypothetical protein
MPRKVFTPGEVLAAADVNEFLQDQAIMTFAGTAARGSAIGTATEGMVTYLADTDTFEFWNGTAYAPLVTPAPSTLLFDIAVIGGGGAGGANGGAGGGSDNRGGGGGGAGGFYRGQVPLVAGTYNVTVGAGGAQNGVVTRGLNGSNSVFGKNAAGGGGGGGMGLGSNSNNPGSNGGSGGGAGEGTSSGAGGLANFGFGTTGQGFRGGNQPAFNDGGPGAGGGGAGGQGSDIPDNSQSTGGPGGAGVAWSVNSVTYAAGGNGANQSGGVTPANATANTGNGGDGSRTTTAANGGSGRVLFALPAGWSVSFSGGVTQTSSTIGDFTVYSVTAAGLTDTVTITEI